MYTVDFAIKTFTIHMIQSFQVISWQKRSTSFLLGAPPEQLSFLALINDCCISLSQTRYPKMTSAHRLGAGVSSALDLSFSMLASDRCHGVCQVFRLRAKETRSQRLAALPCHATRLLPVPAHRFGALDYHYAKSYRSAFRKQAKKRATLQQKHRRIGLSGGPPSRCQR